MLRNIKPGSVKLIFIMAVAALSLSGCFGKEDESSYYTAMLEGDYETGAAAVRQYIDGTGGDKEAYRAMGIALLGTGRFSEAADALTKALTFSNGIVDPYDIDISYYLAVVEYKMGDTQNALSTANAIAALRPRDDGIYFLRAKIELALDDREAAMADFDRTIELAPDDYDRYVGIYEELHARGYDDEAASYLEKAMSVGNKLSDYNKGVLEYYLGSYTDARNDLENAGKSEKSENLTLYLGRTYEALGDSAYAMTLYDDYLREHPSAGRIYEELANCRMKGEDYEGALTVIESGMSLGNGEGVQGMMFDRIVAYERLYDFENARKFMEEYLALFPDDEVAKREYVFLSSR